MKIKMKSIILAGAYLTALFASDIGLVRCLDHEETNVHSSVHFDHSLDSHEEHGEESHEHDEGNHCHDRNLVDSHLASQTSEMTKMKLQLAPQFLQPVIFQFSIGIHAPNSYKILNKAKTFQRTQKNLKLIRSVVIQV